MSEIIPAFIEKDKGKIVKIYLINPEDYFQHDRVKITKMPKKARKKFIRPLLPMLKDLFRKNQKFRRILVNTVEDPTVVARDVFETHIDEIRTDSRW